MQTTSKIDSSWFAHWFDSSFYHRLYSHRDEQEAAGFIDCLVDELDPSQQSEMLDLGCGAGRHAKQLASRGYNVTGIDLAYSSIREARKSERKEPPGQLQFFRHDMRMPFGKELFDYVFNFFTSFGYFNRQEEHEQVIKNISRALKAGGTVVIDYLNTPYSSQRLVAAETKEIDGIHYQITRWEDDQHFYKKMSIADMKDGKPYQFTEQVAKFHVADFDQFFVRHGLRLKNVFGDYQLNSYDRESSPRMILIGEKL